MADGIGQVGGCQAVQGGLCQYEDLRLCHANIGEILWGIKGRMIRQHLLSIEYTVS